MIKKIFYCVFTIALFSPLLYPRVASELFLEGASITGIADEGANIWVATYGYGIFMYSKEKNEWTNFSTKNGTLENDLFYNIAVSKDYVWAGSGSGLFTYDRKRGQWRKRKFAQGGELGNWIRALCYDPSEKTLWIGRFENLTRYEVAKNRYTDFDRTQNNDTKSNNFISARLDGDSLIWFGTESGIHKLYKNKDIQSADAWEYITNKSNAFNNEGDAVSVSDFLFESKNIWFATDEFVTAEKPQFNIGGIYKYDRQYSWERISKKDGLPANGIYCLERTGNKIWAGVYSFDRKDKKEYGKGLVLLDRVSGDVNPINLNELDIKTSTVLSMYFDGTYMWLGTDKGLYRFLIENPLAHWSGSRPEQAKDQ